MSIDELMNAHGNFQVTMTIGDLKEAFKQWSNDVKPDSNDETILTINEVCTMLGCDKSSLWRWDKAGILKKKRAGGKVVYLKCDVMDFLKGKEA